MEDLPVIIFGASGLGRTALEIFNSSGVIAYCFLDDDKPLHNTEIMDVPVLGSTDDDGFLKFIGQKCGAFVAVEEAGQRKSIVEMLVGRRKTMPMNAVHKAAVIAKSASIGNGNLINAGAVLNAASEIGNHCIVNSRAVIEHGAVLGDYVQLGTGAVVGAGAQLAEGVLIGTGAVVVSGVKIGKNAQVAPMSLVMANVPAGETVFGIPAKPLKNS